MANTSFAPQLYIKPGVTNIDFYIKALGAIELRRFANDDGTIHVSELSVDNQLFHLHEETGTHNQKEPIGNNGTTVLIGLFVDDVDLFMNKSITEGATLISPAQDYDYGYRQGNNQRTRLVITGCLRRGFSGHIAIQHNQLSDLEKIS